MSARLAPGDPAPDFTLSTDDGREVSLSDYRVSLGTGIRMKIPFLGQAPFAFDIAIPIFKEDGDETRFFSFDVAVPF